MIKRNIGLAVFWISITWMIAWIVVAKVFWSPLMRTLTLEEINQTIWAYTGPLQFLYGISIPLGAIAAAVGILLYTRARGSTIWMVGVGSFIALILSFATLMFNLYSPPLFGVGGSLILLSFMGILWLWAKERTTLEGSSTAAADFRLVGYVFQLMAAWYLCGKAAEGFVKGLEGLPTMSMMNILIFLALGWLFLFISHYKSRPRQR